MRRYAGLLAIAGALLFVSAAQAAAHRGRRLVRSDREQPRRDIRPDVHRKRNARRPRAALGSGLCRRHGSGAVRARGLLRAGLERSQARRRRAATGQHTDLVDADVRRERQHVRGPRSRCVRLAPVDRPSHRDRHDDGALDRSRRKRHRPDVPGADRPRQPEPRSRSAPVHAALVGGGDRHRRDRRHRGHHRDARADHSGGEGVERGRTSGLGDARDEGDRDPGHAGEPAAGECECPGDDHADRPVHRSERRSGARVPGAVRPDVHDHQVRRRRELAGHRGHHDRRPGAGGVRGRHRLGLAAGSQQGGVGVAVARVDRGARKSHARDRRERQRVLPVVEHAGRRRLERLAGRTIVQRLRRSHLLGCRDVDVPVAARAAPRPGRRHERVPLPAAYRGAAARHRHRQRRRAVPLGKCT